MPGGDIEPPSEIVFDLEEALDLLTALESARDTLRDSDQPAGVVAHYPQDALEAYRRSAS